MLISRLFAAGLFSTRPVCNEQQQKSKATVFVSYPEYICVTACRIRTLLSVYSDVKIGRVIALVAGNATVAIIATATIILWIAQGVSIGPLIWRTRRYVRTAITVGMSYIPYA